MSLLGTSEVGYVAYVLLAIIRLILWPTQILFIGFHGAPAAESLSANAVSITLNALLYAAVGSLLWWLLRRRDFRALSSIGQ
jgi:hypothetical protein